ncbi:MAG: Rrf2 family transcriptional regulator [Phycisphaerae bacterium]|nr:Rrf2 family transcriptional regulator [Phycisphaerae bacterium]
MQLNQMTRYALDLLAGLDDATRIVHLSLLAAHVGVPLREARRVMEKLGKAQLVQGRRGRRGGYALARPLEEITLGDVLAAMCSPGQALEQEPSALVHAVAAFLRQQTAGALATPVECFRGASTAA